MKALRIGFGLLMALLAPPALYAAVAFGLALRQGTPAPAAPGGIEAYVVSNGVHTDLVLPIRSGRIDWTTVFPPEAFPEGTRGAEFIAIGWGDREFYLHTPEWRDLTAARAFGALSGRGRTLLHVTWLRRADLGRRTWHLPLDPAGLDAVVRHVTGTVAPDGSGRAVPLPGAHYGRNDAFFEARGAYDLVTTCNTWTGQALRAAGVPASPWTPFAPNVVRQLEPFSRAGASGTATPPARPGT